MFLWRVETSYLQPIIDKLIAMLATWKGSLLSMKQLAMQSLHGQAL